MQRKTGMALRTCCFPGGVKTQKSKGSCQKRMKVPPRLDDVTVSPEEYEKYLRQAYEAEKFAKPRNIARFYQEIAGPGDGKAHVDKYRCQG